jgi:hypothetical protein
LIRTPIARLANSSHAPPEVAIEHAAQQLSDDGAEDLAHSRDKTIGGKDDPISPMNDAGISLRDGFFFSALIAQLYGEGF